MNTTEKCPQKALRSYWDFDARTQRFNFFEFVLFALLLLTFLLKNTHVGSHLEPLKGFSMGRHTGIRTGSNGIFGQGTQVGFCIGILRGIYVGTGAMDYMTT